MWFSFGKADIDGELRMINHRIGVLMATFAEALAGWTNYANELKAQLEAVNATLADWQAIDATEDAAQAAALEQQLADQVQAALDAVKNPPVVEPDPEPAPEPAPE